MSLKPDDLQDNLKRRTVEQDLQAIRIAKAHGKAPGAAFTLSQIINRRSADILIALAEHYCATQGVKIDAVDDLKRVLEQGQKIVGE